MLNKAEIKRELASHGLPFSTLLGSPEVNPKVKKNLKVNGISTRPLQLSPASISGFNVCASASDACMKACLHFAGNPIYFKAKQKARINRTIAYFKHRELFLKLLKLEIDSAVRSNNKKNLSTGFRLNTTSDIRWETVKLHGTMSLIDYILSLGASVYDYTKHTNRRKAPKSYHLTHSWSGDNVDKCIEAFSNGMNVAIPFSTYRSCPLPSTFKLGDTVVPVFDGDNTDYRPDDPSGVIVGLRFKYNSSNYIKQAEQLSDAIASGFCIDVENDHRVSR